MFVLTEATKDLSREQVLPYGALHPALTLHRRDTNLLAMDTVGTVTP